MKVLYTVAALLFFAQAARSQVGIGTTTPNPHAVLELKSPGSNQGFLLPRLTTAQRNAISLSAQDNGLLVFDSDEQKFYYWQESQWLPIKSGGDTNLVAGAGIDITGNTISAVPDADGDAANEIQDLKLTGNSLTITNNASATAIDLSPLIDADGDVANEIQDLKLTGNSLTITNNASATPIDLSPLIDADGDATNEIQDLQLVGNTLSITNNAGATAIDLAPFAGTNTDNQTLTFDAVTGVLDITGGNNVTLNATGAAGGILSGTYPNPALIDNAISSAKIVDGAVATVDLANLAVTTAKLGDLAVTTSKITDDAITDVKIIDGAVTSGKLANLAVTGGKIADNAITSAKIQDGAVAGADILDGGVGTNDLANVAVTGAKIADNAITNAKILDGTIASAKLTSTGVTANTYGTATLVPQLTVDAAGRITGVSNVTITGVAPSGVATGDLSGTYPAPTIATTAGANILSAINDAGTLGTIATNKLASSVLLDSESPIGGVISGTFGGGLQVNNNAITSAQILNGTIASADIADGTVATADIADGTILTADISDGTIATADIADAAITTNKLNNLAVTTAKIADAAITGAKLENTAVTPGLYGAATSVPQFNVDAHGRITSVTPVTISGVAPAGVAGGLLSGTYPDPGINNAMGDALVTTLNNAATTTKIATGKLDDLVVLATETPTAGVISGTFAAGLQVNNNAITSAQILNGTIASADIADGTIATADIADAAITGAKLETIIATPGVFGAATSVPQFNLDAHGRITSVTPVTISGVAPAGAAGGLLSGTYPNPGINTAMGNALVTSLNDAATTTTIAATKLASSVLLDSESPAAGMISGTFGGGLQVNDDAITSAKILNGTIASTDIADGTIVSGDIADGTILTADISDGTIATADIADAAITTNKLNNLAVTTAKLADVSVTTAKLGDASVSTAKIVDGAVTNAKIPVAEIAPSKIAPSGVIGQVLTTGAGGTAWAALPALGGLGTVTSITAGTGLSGGTITTSGTIAIASGGVTSTEIANATITNADVSATAAIAVSKLAGGSTDGQVLTSNGGIPQWNTPSITASPLGDVLAKGNDAKDQDAVNFNSVTITNNIGSKSVGSGALNVMGSHFVSFTEISADYTIKLNDYIIVCTPTKQVTVTLPKAADNKGRILYFQSNGTSSTTALVVAAGDGLDGQGSSEPLWVDPNFSNNTAYALTVLSTGSTWITISRSIGRSKG